MLCSFDGCGKKVNAHGLCMGHYKQRRAGKELRALSQLRHQYLGLSEYERFMKWVGVEGPKECWLWKGSVHNTGGRTKYGQFTNADRGNELTHRAAWRLMRGPIPAGLFVLHTCDVPLCVNPNHLFLGRQLDNMIDMWSKKRGMLGEKHGNSKLTEALVRDIRSSKESGVQIARRLSLTPTTICDIRKRRTWKHLT